MKKIIILTILPLLAIWYSVALPRPSERIISLTPLDSTICLLHFDYGLQDASGHGNHFIPVNINTDDWLPAMNNQGICMHSVGFQDSSWSEYAYRPAPDSVFNFQGAFTVEMIIMPIWGDVDTSTGSKQQGIVFQREAGDADDLGWEICFFDAQYLNVYVCDGDESATFDTTRLDFRGGVNFTDSSWYYISVVICWPDSVSLYYANLTNGDTLKAHPESPKIMDQTDPVDSVFNPTKDFGINKHISDPDHLGAIEYDEFCITSRALTWDECYARATLPEYADYHKPIAVLVDSSGAAADYDSISYITNALDFGGYDYDIIQLTTEVAGADNNIPYAATQSAFTDSMLNYTLVIIPQHKLAVLGDSASEAQGLSPDIINGLADYVYQGGCVFELDPWVGKWVLPDTVYWNHSFLFNLGAGGNQEDDIIVHGNHPALINYYGNNIDTFHIAESGHIPYHYNLFNIFGKSVDTLAMFDKATDSPMMVSCRYGSGYIVQTLSYMRWFYPKYDGSRDYSTYGPARGLDPLLSGPIDYMLSYNRVSMTRELQCLTGCMVDDIQGNLVTSTDDYAIILGPWTKIGMLPRNSLYLNRVNAVDSSSLQDFHIHDLSSVSYQSIGEVNLLFMDDDTTELTEAQWGGNVDTIRFLEDSTGSDGLRGMLNGLNIEKNFKPTKWLWGRGVSDCVIESLLAWGVHFSDSRYGHYDDISTTVLYENPYEGSQYAGCGWMSFKGEDALYIDKMWQIYFWPDSTYSYDPLITGINWAVADGASDSLPYIKQAYGGYLSAAYKAKFPAVLYIHGQMINVKLGQDDYLPLIAYIGDTLKNMESYAVPAHYIEMFSCYRDSVTIENLRYTKNSYSCKLVHKRRGVQMPIPMYLTFRKVRSNGTVSIGRMIVPGNWYDEIAIRAEYNSRKDKWKFYPGYKAQDHFIRPSFVGTAGWFN